VTLVHFLFHALITSKMSRGGRGGGKRGPDLSWDDEEETATPLASNKPEEQFPVSWSALQEGLGEEQQAEQTLRTAH
jgi:hypothetical protein